MYKKILINNNNSLKFKNQVILYSNKMKIKIHKMEIFYYLKQINNKNNKILKLKI